MTITEPAPAKLNLALHVRGRMADGRHQLDTMFAFCTDGDVLHAAASDALSLAITGPFAPGLEVDGNLVLRAAEALRAEAAVASGAALTLDKRLPIASGIGGGSADAAAALRLLTRLWRIDPALASAVAPGLGSDVPACLLSLTSRGSGAGDRLELIDLTGVTGTPVLLVNPRVPLGTGAVFAAWDGQDRGPIGEWRAGRNDLAAPATSLVPAIGEVLEWLVTRPGASLARMSGSGATCFALFDDERSRSLAAEAVPDQWWHLATYLR